MRPLKFAQFAEDVLPLSCPRTPENRPAKMRQVLRELGLHCRTTRDLTPAAVAKWLADHPDRSAATHRSLLSALSGLRVWRARKLPGESVRVQGAFRVASGRRAGRARAVQATSVRWPRSGWCSTRRTPRRSTGRAVGRGTWSTVTRSTPSSERISGFGCATSTLWRDPLDPLARGTPAQDGARVARLPWWDRCRGSWPCASRRRPCDGSLYLFPTVELTGPWFHGRPGRRPFDQDQGPLGPRAGVPA